MLASRAATQQAVGAYQAHDVPGFLRYAIEAERLRPDHGTTVYNLACARALTHDTAAALDALRRFARLGYTADVAADSDLVSLRALPAFDSIRAGIGRNAAPLVRGRRAFTLPEKDLLTEGIAYDARSRAFFVGSVHRRKILRVDRAGRVTEFVRSGSRAPWAPLGMRVDAERGVLWVAATAVPQIGRVRSGPTVPVRRLFGFDVRHRAAHAAASSSPTTAPARPGRPGPSPATATCTPATAGAPTIYRVRAGADSLERFVTSPLLLSAEGLALDSDGADALRGRLLARHPPRGPRLPQVRASSVQRPALGLLGIDGLYPVGRRTWSGSRTVSTPHRVVRLRLSRAATGSRRWKCWSAPGRTMPSRPSASWWAESFYYVANSQWERFGEDGGIDAPDRLRPPLVLRLRL